MFRSVLPLAAVLTVLVSGPVAAQDFLPVVDASMQVRGQLRPDGGGAGQPGQPRMELGDIVRQVSAGRPGRMVGITQSGDSNYRVRWEYPGGRVADIIVDGRTGRVIGER